VIEEATAVSGNTGSEAGLNQLVAWMEDCQSQHNLCPKNLKQTLPTRVLDLGLSDISPNIKLLETTGESDRYACLSHRWIHGDTICTTLSNIRERKELILWDTLPKRFQQSITVARRLGLRYIWIDSLCIIQGPESDDWLMEAPKMATYYKNGYITLSASCAIGAGDGCFQIAPNTSTICRALFHAPGFEYQVHCRFPLEHQPLPLHSRGWVYQEHVLSPRVVHFAQELIWECFETTKCECSRIVQNISPQIFFPVSPSETTLYTPVFGRKQALNRCLISENKQNVRDLWRGIVSEYTHKTLTYDDDIFPALAGLAKQMQIFRKCSYYAGLWEDTLITDLLWAAKDKDSRIIGYEYPRPTKWRAPTWSWASTTAPVSWDHIGISGESRITSSEDLIKWTFINEVQAECVPQAGHDSTMRLRSGILSFNGHLSPAPAFHMEGQELKVDKSTKYEEDMSFFQDFKFADENGTLNVSIKDLECVLVGAIPKHYYFSIILRPVCTRDAIYERIGLLRHTHRCRLDDGACSTRITII
jgi:hypothetical protein